MGRPNLIALAFGVCTALESARKIYQIYALDASAQIKSAPFAIKEI